MHGSHSYDGRGGKRSQVEFVLDGKDNFSDGMAYFFHKMHQNRRRGSGCGCGGRGCSSCWSPATSWFDYNRAYISYVRDMFDCLYGRSGCGPSYCEPECEPDCPSKLLVAVVHGEQVTAKFKVFNPTCDPVKLEVTVEGFPIGGGNDKWVTVVVENNKVVLDPAEAVTITVAVRPPQQLAPATYNGSIVVKTPFSKKLPLEAQVS